jgi:regulator of sirC expression with transglutaminase-like and TPR domain
MGERVSNAISHRAAKLADHVGEDELDLAAIEIARFAHPDLDADTVLARLDALASEVVGDTHLALRRIIGIKHGIGGNVDDYENPDNSYLNRVIETRRGIPISLSILWMEVGRRAGLEMQGVGLPGHFVVYAAGQLVDPFHYGEAIGFDEAASLIANAIGGDPRLDRRWLEPVETAEIIRRVLRNLENAYPPQAPESEWISACQMALKG